MIASLPGRRVLRRAQERADRGALARAVFGISGEIADAQIADSLTLSGASSVDPDALVGDVIDDNLIDAGVIAGTLADGQISDGLTIGPTGSALRSPAGASVAGKPSARPAQKVKS